MNPPADELMDVIIPCIPQGFPVVRRILPFLRRYLPFRRLVIIGPLSVKELVRGLALPDVTFICEEELVDCRRIRELIEEREPLARCRAGWYIQQFVKMAYAFVCSEPRYLVWDADTVPCKNYQCQTEDGRLIFDLKSEHHAAYFATFARLFPELRARNAGSYISEHMPIEAALMREMLEGIGGRAAFAERILLAVDRKDLPLSGFSEFETFGTWCLNQHPESYSCRTWTSLRNGAAWISPLDLDEGVLAWIGEGYDAISFESWELRRAGFMRRLWLRNWLVRRLYDVNTAMKVWSEMTEKGDGKRIVLFAVSVWVVLSVWAYFCVNPICADMLRRYAPMAEYFAAGEWRLAFHPRFGVQFPVLTGSLVWLTGMSGVKACQMVSVAYFSAAVIPIGLFANRLAGRLAAYLAIAFYLTDFDLVMLAIDGWRDDGKVLPLMLTAMSFMRLIEGKEDRHKSVGAFSMATALLLLTTLRVEGFPLSCIYLLIYVVLAARYCRWSAVCLASLGWLLGTMFQCAVTFAHEGCWVPSAQILNIVERFL